MCASSEYWVASWVGKETASTGVATSGDAATRAVPVLVATKAAPRVTRPIAAAAPASRFRMTVIQADRRRPGNRAGRRRRWVS